MMSPVYRPLATADSPRSTPSNKTHNVPKHPHGAKNKKHQPQAAGAAHTRHLLPTPKAVLRIVGSIRPPSAPKPRVEVTLPSREEAPAFVTFSPFDAKFPAFAANSKFAAKAAPAAFQTHHVQKKQHAKKHHAANDHARHGNVRHFKQMPTEKAHKNKHHVVARRALPKAKVAETKLTGSSSRKITGKRMIKEHAHHIPRKVGDKRPWHLAGWVTYSPFDANFDRVCKTGVWAKGIAAPVRRQRKQKAHAHHAAGRPHHPGHHQAHHVRANQQQMSPAAKVIADYYAATAMAPFPRLSPTAAMPSASSFFMPPPRLSVTSVSMTPAMGSMSGLPGSMRAFTPRAPAYSSGFAW